MRKQSLASTKEYSWHLTLRSWSAATGNWRSQYPWERLTLLNGILISEQIKDVRCTLISEQREYYAFSTYDQYMTVSFQVTVYCALEHNLVLATAEPRAVVRWKFISGLTASMTQRAAQTSTVWKGSPRVVQCWLCTLTAIYTRQFL